MKKFVYIYCVSQLIPDDDANVALWGQFFEKLGPNLVDQGSTFESEFQAQVSAGKVTKDPDEIAGYSIVTANSLEEAISWIQEGPLSRMKNLLVRVYEAR